jgi:hypothetical protein
LQQHGLAPTHVPFILGAPARMPSHLLGVLRERLARVVLPAPVEALILESEETAPLAGRNLGLLPSDEVADAQVPLVDRLRARLGDDAVLLLAPHAEHRPKKAIDSTWRLPSNRPRFRRAANPAFQFRCPMHRDRCGCSTRQSRCSIGWSKRRGC